MVRFITRRGGGMPDRTFDSIVDAAYWVIGERLSKGLPRTVANVLKTQGRHYGFDWTTRERRVTRRGGGLPDRTFDTVMDAARWCRGTGLSRTKNDVGAYSTILSVCFKKCQRFCGFEWELERPEDVEAPGKGRRKAGRRKGAEPGAPAAGRREQGRGLPELVRILAANGLDDRAIAEALEVPLPVVARARKMPVVLVRDRIKAQFHEDRKRIGLSRNMLADMLGVTPAAVKSWETPGKASVPGYARELLSGLLDEYRGAVEQVVSGARGRSVTLGCYFSQGQYRESGHARGHYAMANAVNREAAAILENRGTVVEFAYPDDAAAARNHVPEPEIALPVPAGGTHGDTTDADAPTALAAEATAAEATAAEATAKKEAAKKGTGEPRKARRRKKRRTLVAADPRGPDDAGTAGRDQGHHGHMGHARRIRRMRDRRRLAAGDGSRRPPPRSAGRPMPTVCIPRQERGGDRKLRRGRHARVQEGPPRNGGTPAMDVPGKRVEWRPKAVAGICDRCHGRFLCPSAPHERDTRTWPAFKCYANI